MSAIYQRISADDLGGGEEDGVSSMISSGVSIDERSSSSSRGDTNGNPKSQDLVSEEAVAHGYHRKLWKLLIYYLLNIIFLGIPWLLSRWMLHWRIKLTCKPCALQLADTILIINEAGERTICDVNLKIVNVLPEEYAPRVTKSPSRTSQHQNPRTRLLVDDLMESSKTVYRFFTYREQKYVWDPDQQAFTKVEGLGNISCRKMFEDYRGMCPDRRMQLKNIYGNNEIAIEIKNYAHLFFDEVLNPFYIFQIFSIALWCLDEYYYYAACVIFISGSSIGTSLYKTRSQSRTLQMMARGSGDFLVSVRRQDGSTEEIYSQDLVPGDVLLIPPEGFIMPCDAVLIQGKCIVNESMLTGESVPVNKSGLTPSSDIFDCEAHKKHVLFCGTDVIQPRFYAGNNVACVVVRTGYSTLKGQLIRSILYPKEVGFQFYTDSMKFVFLLFCVALCGMVYCIYLYIYRASAWYVVLVRVLDIVTIVVPPALPAAMTVGTLNAQSRLKLHQIFCISPQRINFCGKVKVICFDKTGTLTEEGLNLSCVVPVTIGENGIEEFEDPVNDVQQLPESSHLLKGMATCHSLTYIKENIVGDPLDVKMFEATGWELEEPKAGVSGENSRFDLLSPTVVKKGDTELAILKEFDFTPQHQRMSVVTKCLNPMEIRAYCKGAPERIRPLCRNVPANYDKLLDWFTVKGFRVLALGWKSLDNLSWLKIQKLTREQVECDLSFAGFLIMQNSLKPATVPVIKELTNANIRIVMVTGDHMLTALSVARECGMIPKQDKVVIVSVNEAGKLEYTLAAQHYEACDEDITNNGNPRDCSSLTNNNAGASYDSDLNVQMLPEGDMDVDEQLSSTEACEGALLCRRLSKRFSFESDNQSDTVIDTEKMIPFGPEQLLEGSSYHFALTGSTWMFLQKDEYKSECQKIVAKGAIYARMSPECKMQLVESLQEIGYVTAMCGDGANDCSALSMAHVGISLSEAEASVAAPFTSKVADISCVPKLILEGRCALVTSFGIFKYMALYSMVQFASVLILYTHMTNLADTQFLWIDLAITMTVTVAMGRTKPVRRLVPKRPMSSLVSFPNVFSIFSQILICVVLQFAAMLLLKSQVWFVPVKPSETDMQENTYCWETTTIFSISSFQYLIMSVVFSKGKPFRKPFYYNFYLLFATFVLTASTAVLAIYPVTFLADFFGLMPVSSATQDFRFLLMILPVINMLLSTAIENYIVGSKLIKRCGKSFKTKAKSPYKKILEDLKADPNYPPLRPPCANS